ncbi:MAG TPA: hypothetical protein VJ780_00560 [Flavobacterium sp.]|nr:hypothetical protein [Flavobacterium sp.]
MDKNQLNVLISLYEDEKVQLQKLIDECLVETEYLMAHYHSQALYQLNGRLQTLHNIDDKLYDEKYFRQRGINGLQKQIDAENSEYMKEYLENRLQREKEELEKLNQIPKQATLPYNETLLDETIKKMIDKKIKNLKLILKKTDNLLLSFSYSNKILKVSLPYVKQHTKKWILYDDNINSFKNLGFDLVQNETKLVLTITGDKEEILYRMKIILSKIVFEIFYFKEFDNESYIQFTDNASR